MKRLTRAWPPPLRARPTIATAERESCRCTKATTKKLYGASWKWIAPARAFSAVNNDARPAGCARRFFVYSANVQETVFFNDSPRAGGRTSPRSIAGRQRRDRRNHRRQLRGRTAGRHGDDYEHRYRDRTRRGDE